MKNVIVLGATSAIAQEVVRQLALIDCNLFLIGRDPNKLESVANDAKTRNSQIKVDSVASDILNYDSHIEWIKQAESSLGQTDTLIVAHALDGVQREAEVDFELSRKLFEINFLSVVSFVTKLLPVWKQRKGACIAVIGSVAGDRGRQSNFLYGTSKGALERYLQGLRNRLFPEGIHVLLVKPGFVDTPMTAHMKKGPLFVKPDKIARGIINSIEKRKDVIYLPFFWKWIMLIIRSIPETIFKRLNL